MKLLPFALLFFFAPAFAQPNEHPKIVEEQSGNITNYRIEGSLETTHTIGCIPLAEVKNTFTPPDLYKGVGECIAKNDYDLAARLFALAGIYASFDTQRIADETAVEAKTILITNMFSSLPEDKGARFGDAIDQLMENPDTHGVLCSQIRKIGRPNYYPSYMISHGIKSFMGIPHDGGLLKDFDSHKVWMTLQTEYLHCSLPKP